MKRITDLGVVCSRDICWSIKFVNRIAVSLLFVAAVTTCAPTRVQYIAPDESRWQHKGLLAIDAKKLGTGGTRVHYGVDLAGEVGDTVYAMYGGTVAKVGGSRDLGSRMVRAVMSHNGKDWFVDYGHLLTTFVEAGDRVVPLQKIGLMGRDLVPIGVPTHVHVQIWRYVDDRLQGFVEPRWEGKEE